MTPGSALHDFFLHLKERIHLRNLIKLKASVFTLAGIKIALTHGALSQIVIGKLLMAKVFMAHIMGVSSIAIKILAVTLIA